MVHDPMFMAFDPFPNLLGFNFMCLNSLKYFHFLYIYSCLVIFNKIWRQRPMCDWFFSPLTACNIVYWASCLLEYIWDWWRTKVQGWRVGSVGIHVQGQAWKGTPVVPALGRRDRSFPAAFCLASLDKWCLDQYILCLRK